MAFKASLSEIVTDLFLALPVGDEVLLKPLEAPQGVLALGGLIVRMLLLDRRISKVYESRVRVRVRVRVRARARVGVRVTVLIKVEFGVGKG